MQSNRDRFIEVQENVEDDVEMEGDYTTRFQGLTLEEFDEWHSSQEDEIGGRDEARMTGNEIE